MRKVGLIVGFQEFTVEELDLERESEVEMYATLDSTTAYAQSIIHT